MAELMAARCAMPAAAVIVPVPTSTKRVRQRGYDQAVLLARRIAREINGSYVGTLERHGQQQQRNASRAQRLKQLQDAFVISHPDRIRGKHVVLVDDVVTTGATLEAAAHALKAAGAGRVSAVVFAQA
jgi:ComF family protein